MQRISGSARSEDRDFLAAEEPLEIRVEGHSVAVVMRTPGEDRELAAGFLVNEGLVHVAGYVVDIRHRPHCLFSVRDGSARNRKAHETGSGKGVSRAGPELSLSDGNLINVRLRNPESLDLKKLTRHIFTSSSCGICSKASIDAVRQQFAPVEDLSVVEPQVLLGLPQALAAGIPIVAAISALSSLAAEFARESGQTLVGFLRGERMNVYAGANRLLLLDASRQTFTVAG
jgi:FdhD protein